MSELKIEVAGRRTAFQPGEEIEILAEWRLTERPDRVEVRLVWHTQGKGDRDWSLVETIGFDGPQSYESRNCRLKLPDAPYSFSGKLISLLWSLEVVAEPSGQSQRLDIVIAPNGEEVLLQRDLMTR